MSQAVCRRFLLNSRVFIESCAFFQRFFRLLKLFVCLSLLLAVFLRSFAIIHYSLVATSLVFAELKQFKAICLGNRHMDTRHTHTLTLTDYTHSEVKYIPIINYIKVTNPSLLMLAIVPARFAS